MIILKHLTVERFRLLREINLHFPQRGSILVQGPNEAGKTALLESIYFALYGVPLAAPSVADYGRNSLDDLVRYGSSQANVTLTLSIGATELVINRIIDRMDDGIYDLGDTVLYARVRRNSIGDGFYDGWMR